MDQVGRAEKFDAFLYEFREGGANIRNAKVDDRFVATRLGCLGQKKTNSIAIKKCQIVLTLAGERPVPKQPKAMPRRIQIG